MHDAANAGTKFPKKPYPDALMRGDKGVKAWIIFFLGTKN